MYLKNQFFLILKTRGVLFIKNGKRTRGVLIVELWAYGGWSVTSCSSDDKIRCRHVSYDPQGRNKMIDGNNEDNLGILKLFLCYYWSTCSHSKINALKINKSRICMFFFYLVTCMCLFFYIKILVKKFYHCR
jgi:hypothetical protein